MIVRSTTFTDFLTIDEWRKNRNVSVLSRDLYPAQGLIVPNVAAGFLTLTDSSVALMENFVSNPGAPREERREAIKEIGLRLEIKARDLGFKKLVAITAHNAISDACEELGYQYLGVQMMFGKEI